MIWYSFDKILIKIEEIRPSLRALMATWDFDYKIENPFRGMLYNVSGSYG